MVEGGETPESLIEWDDEYPAVSRNGWCGSMVRIIDYDRRSIIFPPINHEGLLISTETETETETDSLPSPRPSPAASCWSLAFHFLRSKLTRNATTRLLGRLLSLAHVVAPMLLLLLYLRFRRQKDKRDHLIRLIKQKDEKITQLLHKIAEMNELLLALHTLPISRTA